MSRRGAAGPGTVRCRKPGAAKFSKWRTLLALGFPRQYGALGLGSEMGWPAPPRGVGIGFPSTGNRALDRETYWSIAFIFHYSLAVRALYPLKNAPYLKALGFANPISSDRITGKPEQSRTWCRNCGNFGFPNKELGARPWRRVGAIPSNHCAEHANKVTMCGAGVGERKNTQRTARTRFRPTPQKATFPTEPQRINQQRFRYIRYIIYRIVSIHLFS
ncbi:hypothetical protein DQ04_14161000 [Trypanosoma grayi]|uniref:hypothetical protein n=1 Tax=Trypanosoma grayi TaxID=71804 RepID=UPI0004F41FEC|nr:hypothetical protein DQ04_14161000 [Trypanosoma grayi]KEG06392.1 hypothetical protein DQ04_14161000 [Trypanosoma grayi]